MWVLISKTCVFYPDFITDTSSIDITSIFTYRVFHLITV